MKSEKGETMKRIWITGASGHVGAALVELLDTVEYELFLTDLDVDVTSLDDVVQFCHINRPDVIINCASVTGLSVCEGNPDEAYRVNAIGVRNIALAANEINAKVIHLSTDDVFSHAGETRLTEFDTPAPITVYGKSKLAGEKLLTELMNRFVIIRSSWVYGIGKDCVSTVLTAVKEGQNLSAPTNVFGAPTSAKELAKVIYRFIEKDEFGIYHAVCLGSCSRYEFMQTILDYTGNTGKISIEPTTVNQNEVSGAVLDNMMLRLSGLSKPSTWQEALKSYLEETGGDE